MTTIKTDDEISVTTGIVLWILWLIGAIIYYS